MNKRRVDDMIPAAYRALASFGIMGDDASRNGKWRGQIAAFGASIAQGSLLAAVSFFSDQGGAETKRERLMMAIWQLLHKEELLTVPLKPKTEDEEKAYKEAAIRLYKQVEKQPNDRRLKEDILSAAVALKLAMNLYNMGRGGGGNAKASKDEFQLSAE